MAGIGIAVPGGPVGSTLPQAPIRGLQRAFQQPQGMSMMPSEDDEAGPDRSGLGQRQPDMAMQGLMSIMKKFGRVY